MYIGSTGQRGLHHLIYEILDNAIDEAQGGHARQVWLEMDLDSGWVRVRDDGRGIPTDKHPVTGVSALETVLTVLHAGGKFGGEASGYAVSGGLHGVGLSVVNALSSELRVGVWRAGRRHVQQYKVGVPQGSLAIVDEAEALSHMSSGSSDQEGPSFTPDASLPVEGSRAERLWRGTDVWFRYDPDVFASSATFDPQVIRSRLRELAFLNKDLTVHFRVLPKNSKKAQAFSDDGEWLDRFCRCEMVITIELFIKVCIDRYPVEEIEVFSFFPRNVQSCTMGAAPRVGRSGRVCDVPQSGQDPYSRPHHV